MIKGGALEARREDTFELDFVYDGESTNVALFQRSIRPLIECVLKGYNAVATVIGTQGIELKSKLCFTTFPAVTFLTKAVH